MPDNRPTINILHRTIVPRGNRRNATEFSNFFHQRLRECREGGKPVRTRDVAEKLGIEYGFFRKKVGGQKPIKKRDLVIAICMVLRLDPAETNMALRMHSMLELKGNKEIDEDNITREDLRDDVLRGFLESSFVSIDEVNVSLAQNGFRLLDLNDSRKPTSKVPHSPPLSIVKKEVFCDIDYILYFGNGSLNMQYNPAKYQIAAQMWVEDTNTGERFLLILGRDSVGTIIDKSIKDQRADEGHSPDGNGLKKAQALDDGHQLWGHGYGCGASDHASDNPIQQYDGSERFKSCFTELQRMVDSELARLMAIANDSKNYKGRVSAKLINREIYIFYEQFNYTMPEMTEYFWMEYHNGQYMFSVQKVSVFLWKYLGKEAYNKYIGRDPVTIKTSYSSLAELEQTFGGGNPDFSNYQDKTKLAVLNKAFITAKTSIDRLLEDLRTRKKFIRDIAEECPTPLAPLWFYNALELFDCTCDEEYTIIPGKQSALYPLEEYGTVNLSVEDVLRGYELGFDSIHEIAEAIATKGDIENILK